MGRDFVFQGLARRLAAVEKKDGFGLALSGRSVRRRTALLFEADRSPGKRAARKFDQRTLFSLALAFAADKAALASQLY
jgi:hypothetical protein